MAGADSAEASAQLLRVSDLVRDACTQIDQLLIGANSRLSAEERARFEDALQELRYAIQYLALQNSTDPGGSP